MSKEKSEKIRLYVLLGLTAVLVVALLFRFTQKGDAEATGETTAEVTGESAPGRLAIPEVNFDVLKSNRLLTSAVRQVLRDPVRDIFLQGGAIGVDDSELPAPGSSVSLASLKLKGVVAGGRNPLALINDTFVRTGDSIDGYRVVRIDKKEVLLDSGIETFRLELKERD